MTDIAKALEAAAAVLRVQALSMDEDTDEAWLAEARAAVLAFLKAMPEVTKGNVLIAPDTYLRVGWNLHDLAAAVEKETQP